MILPSPALPDPSSQISMDVDVGSHAFAECLALWWLGTRGEAGLLTL